MLPRVFASETRFSTTFSPTEADIFPRFCRELRWDTQYPILPSTFQVLEWLAMIVLLSSLFLRGLSFTGSWRWGNPLLYFYEKDGEDQTRDLTVHNITSCRRRHCEEVDKKCYVAILPSKLDFQSQYFVGFLGGMVRDIAPETLYPGTRRVIDTTRTRTGSERSGYYPSGTRVVDKRGTTLVHQCQVPCLLYTSPSPRD